MVTLGNTASDAELIRRTQAGDKRAFSELVKRHQDAVYNVAYRLVGDPEMARDLTQEAFISMYRGIASYRHEARFTTWAYVIVRNLCSTRIKKNAREMAYLTPEGESDGKLEHVAAMDADPVDGALRHELQSGMMAALMTLSMSHRLVLTLYYFEAMGYEEIATVVGFPVGTVKTHLHRAKAAMRRAMQAKELV